jgi:NADH-quinone oxidoreductase subunit G
MSCLGTSCHLRGGQGLVHELVSAVEARGLQQQVDVRATFCLERCGEGPNVKVGDRVVTGATVTTVLAAIDEALGRPA